MTEAKLADLHRGDRFVVRVLTGAQAFLVLFASVHAGLEGRWLVVTPVATVHLLLVGLQWVVVARDLRVRRELAIALASILAGVVVVVLASLLLLRLAPPPLPWTPCQLGMVAWIVLAGSSWNAGAGLRPEDFAPPRPTPAELEAAHRVLRLGFGAARPADREVLGAAVHGRGGLPLDGPLTPHALAASLEEKPALVAAWLSWAREHRDECRWIFRGGNELVDREEPGTIREFHSMPVLVAAHFLSEAGRRLARPAPEPGDEARGEPQAAT